ncbi:MAG: protein jag [Armatimonadetes bacterium]|nr:protein jag [Armatimonadota bacterium]
MNFIEQTGNTIEEAKSAALKELGAKFSDEVDFEIVEEGSPGIFGFGAKEAKITARLKETDPLVLAQEILDKIFQIMQIEVKFEKKEMQGEEIVIHLQGENLGFLIGKYGQTLSALQNIVNLIINHNLKRKIYLFLDIENYRSRRERALQDLAYKMAEAVKTEKRSLVLEPMTANERRVIHLVLQNHPEVISYSSGEEPLRKVIIAPKQDNK